MKKLFLGLMLLMSSYAEADSLNFGYGVGVANSASSYIGEVKTITLGINREIWNGIFYQTDVGIWADSQAGRSSSGFGNFSLGLEVNPGYFVIRSSWGLAVVTHTDFYLGGNFPNFKQDLFIGVRDHKDNTIGINYSHLSSAGIHLPNVGRDFITIQLGFGL